MVKRRGAVRRSRGAMGGDGGEGEEGPTGIKLVLYF